MSNLETAIAWFDSCERGDGWEACKVYCTSDAKFRCQASAFHPPLADEPNLGGLLENYVECMKMFVINILPGGYPDDVVSAYDPKTSNAIICATFHGKHTKNPEEAMLHPPTNKSTVSDYVYRIHFNQDGKIDGMIKVWNNEWSGRELGWLD